MIGDKCSAQSLVTFPERARLGRSNLSASAGIRGGTAIRQGPGWLAQAGMGRTPYSHEGSATLRFCCYETQ